MTLFFNSQFPSNQEFIGPGYLWTALSNGTPIPGHTYQLLVNVYREPTLALVMQMVKPNYVFGTNWDFIFGCRRNAGDQVGTAAAGLANGDSAHAVLEVDDLTAGAIADGPTQFGTFVMDMTGQAYICTLIDSENSAGGGFTSADRQLLTAVDQAVVLPSYQQAAISVGLTGTGSLNTQAGTRALRVTVTSFPANVDRFPGTPEYFFNLGFFTMNVGQGWVKSQRLVFEFQTYEAPQALDSFGWTLTPGTTINVEQLIRTP